MVFGTARSVLFIDVSSFQGVLIRDVPLYIQYFYCHMMRWIYRFWSGGEGEGEGLGVCLLERGTGGSGINGGMCWGGVGVGGRGGEERETQ